MKDWIERYVHAVGLKLPRKQRQDIERELTSTLYDMLEERTNGREPSEAEVLAILRTFGPPSEVARRYRPDDAYLVGPELYDLYRMILAIALGAMALGLTVAFAVGGIEKEGPLMASLPGLLGALFSGGLSAIGSVTLVFFIIQRFSAPRSPIKAPESDPWNPEDLPSLPQDRDRADLSETVATIVFTLIALTVFNLFPEKIAVFSFTEKGLDRVPLFTLVILRPYVYAFSVLWLLQLLVAFRLLATRKKTTALRWATVFISLGGLAIFLLAAGNPALLNPEALAFFPSETTGFFRLGGRLLVLVVIAATLADVIKSLMALFRKS